MQRNASKPSRGGLPGSSTTFRQRLVPAAPKTAATRTPAASLPPLLINTSDKASVASAKQSIVTCVRVRPAPPTAAGEEPEEPPWLFDAQANVVTRASQSDVAASELRFDSVIRPHEGIEGMYDTYISPIVCAAVAGYNSTIFAYGQSGSGKTHTMEGGRGELGIVPKAAEEVFRLVKKDSKRTYQVRVSYLEVYNEALTDLLALLPRTSASSLSVSDVPASPVKGGSKAGSAAAAAELRLSDVSDSVPVSGLREELVTSSANVLKLLEAGAAHRRTAATERNAGSSRSHAILTLTVESCGRVGSEQEIRVSALRLIDLAGSEASSADTERRTEGAFINKSLLTLGTVISKLSEAPNNGAAQHQQQHIPYRDSKLTRLLRTSLNGNARVAVVLAISPTQKHAVETLNTLNFGARCKRIQTDARRGIVKDNKRLLSCADSHPAATLAISATSWSEKDLLERTLAAMEAESTTAVLRRYMPVIRSEMDMMRRANAEVEAELRDVRARLAASESSRAAENHQFRAELDAKAEGLVAKDVQIAAKDAKLTAKGKEVAAKNEEFAVLLATLHKEREAADERYRQLVAVEDLRRAMLEAQLPLMSQPGKPQTARVADSASAVKATVDSAALIIDNIPVISIDDEETDDSASELEAAESDSSAWEVAEVRATRKPATKASRAQVRPAVAKAAKRKQFPCPNKGCTHQSATSQHQLIHWIRCTIVGRVCVFCSEIVSSGASTADDDIQFRKHRQLCALKYCNDEEKRRTKVDAAGQPLDAPIILASVQVTKRFSNGLFTQTFYYCPMCVHGGTDTGSNGLQVSGIQSLRALAQHVQTHFLEGTQLLPGLKGNFACPHPWCKEGSSMSEIEMISHLWKQHGIPLIVDATGKEAKNASVPADLKRYSKVLAAKRPTDHFLCAHNLIMTEASKARKQAEAGNDALGGDDEPNRDSDASADDAPDSISSASEPVVEMPGKATRKAPHRSRVLLDRQ